MSSHSSHSHSSPLTGGEVDSIVLNTIRNNKFSSVVFVGFITNIPDDKVQQSVDRLVQSRKIYLSVGGYPKRYSSSDELKSKSQPIVEYQENMYQAPILPEGTVIHN